MATDDATTKRPSRSRSRSTPAKAKPEPTADTAASDAEATVAAETPAEATSDSKPEARPRKAPRASKPAAGKTASPRKPAAAKATAAKATAAKPATAKPVAAKAATAAKPAAAKPATAKPVATKAATAAKPASAKLEQETPLSPSEELASPDVSVVIPVYNEEGILSASIHDLFAKIRGSEKLAGLRFEVILSANGCRDRTVDIAQELMKRYPELRLLASDEPNYGKALRMGILEARGALVVCDEIDLCDVEFYERALYRLREEGYDMVVGSKRLERSFDKRPPMRRFATSVINWMLWLATGFEGTDTHGLKAFRRDRVLGVVEKCVVDRDMFASELVIRTGRDGLRVTEIPLEVIEKRAPSVNLAKRVPRVLRQLATLTWVIRFQRS